MFVPDYYALLGVPATATFAQIKLAYRRLARLYHPDLNHGVQDTRIKQLNEAYDILSNAVKRNLYDIQRLEELRRAILLDALEHHQAAQPMTWTDGLAGFLREMRKEMQE